MKIYSDKKYLPAQFRPCHMLYPFWGFNPVPASSPEFRPLLDSPQLNLDRLQVYAERGRDIFELTDLKPSDVAVLPFDWRYIVEEGATGKPVLSGSRKYSDAMKLADEMAAVTESENTPLCVFLSHPNSTIRVPLANSIVFRRSILRSKQFPNEFALPLWVNDDINAAFDGILPLRERATRPTISFMGYDPLARPAKGRTSLRAGLSSWLRAAGYGRPHPFQARSAALRQLSRNSALDCQFIIRDKWWNGAVRDASIDADRMRQSHQEFVANMIRSDYVLCARGEGNCSYRLYEALCCGRIPIFINTDSVLPYEKWIDWKDYFVWVEEKDLPDIGDIVLDFHERITDRRFRELQRACRQLWLDWLSPQGFFANFYRHFQ